MSGHNPCQQQQQLIAVAQQQQPWWQQQQQQLQVTCIVGLLAIKPPSTKVRMLGSASSGVVLMKAAAGHSHVSTPTAMCHVDESSCRAQPCQRTHQNGQTASSTAATFIRTLPERIWGGETRRGGGGGRPGGCEAWYYRELVKVALLLMPSFQIVLLVYRGLAGRHLACRLG